MEQRKRADALIIVDLQVDFLPGGALAVPEGDAVIEPINRMALRAWDMLAVTKDWHPPVHASFKSSGGPWTEHCIRGTHGAELAGTLRIIGAPDVYHKEEYSGFTGTDLGEALRSEKVTHVVVCGLALDYCVKATALDAAALGYQTTVALGATAAVDPDAIPAVLRELQAAGVEIRQWESIVSDMDIRRAVGDPGFPDRGLVNMGRVRKL